MLQLIQVLFSVRHKALSRWTLSAAEWDFPSCSEASTWTAVKESQGFSHLTLAAHGVMIDGGFADLLRVHYIKPGKRPPSSAAATVPPQASPFHTFSSGEIRRYAEETGDPSAQDAQTVPPLLLLKTLLQKYPTHSGQIRFHGPIPMETPIFLLRNEMGMTGYANDGTLFDVSVN